MDVDRPAPRLLARRSELGYVTHTTRALSAEHEAVSADEQRELTRQAGRSARERDRDAWRESRQRLERELAYLYSLRLHRDVVVQLAALERQIGRLDRRLGR